jgi:hypothetical protein
MAQSAGSTGVHPEPYLLEVPFVALLHTVLGVPPEHPRLPALRAGFEAITVPFEVHLPTPPSIARGYADLVAITHELAEVAADSPCRRCYGRSPGRTRRTPVTPRSPGTSS